MPGSPLGSPDNPLRVAVIGSGPSGFYAAERLLNAERPVGAGRHLRPPADALRPRARRRGARPPEDQVGDAGLRQDRRAPRVPLLRQRRGGARHRARRDAGLLPRHHLRGGRPDRPAHVDPARAPARQPLGHRVRRVVQRPPRLPAHALQPAGHAARRWSATATWRWTWRAAGEPARPPGRHRHLRPRPGEPGQEPGARHPHPRPPGPGPGRVHQQGDQGARRAPRGRRDRRPGRDGAGPGEPGLRGRQRRQVPRAQPGDPARLRRARADRRADADLPALPGVADRDHRRGLGDAAGAGSQRALCQRRRQRAAPPHRPPLDDRGRAGLPGDRLQGRAAARAALRRSRRGGPERGWPGRRRRPPRSRSWAST